MIRMSDLYAVYAYEQGWADWFKFKDRFADLTYSDRHYKLGYQTAMRQAQ